jgi:hypothetical protein
MTLARTYTVLVTIVNDTLPGTEQLAGQIHRALEEGFTTASGSSPAVRGVLAASVDAFIGDIVEVPAAAPGVEKIKRFHRIELLDNHRPEAA